MKLTVTFKLSYGNKKLTPNNDIIFYLHDKNINKLCIILYEFPLPFKRILAQPIPQFSPSWNVVKLYCVQIVNTYCTHSWCWQSIRKKINIIINIMNIYYEWKIWTYEFVFSKIFFTNEIVWKTNWEIVIIFKFNENLLLNVDINEFKKAWQSKCSQ